MIEIKEKYDRSDVKSKITKIKGDSAESRTWTVFAEAWLEIEGEVKYKRSFVLNVLKEFGYFEEKGDAEAKIWKRIEKSYLDKLYEDPDITDVIDPDLEEERKKASVFEGKVHNN